MQEQILKVILIMTVLAGVSTLANFNVKQSTKRLDYSQTESFEMAETHTSKKCDINFESIKSYEKEITY